MVVRRADRCPVERRGALACDVRSERAGGGGRRRGRPPRRCRRGQAGSGDVIGIRRGVLYTQGFGKSAPTHPSAGDSGRTTEPRLQVFIPPPIQKGPLRS